MNLPKIENLMVINLTIDMTDDEIIDCMKKMKPLCAKDGFFLCINGFDSDPREIWEIPEVISFLKKLISFGFLSLLEISSAIEGFTRLGKNITAGGGFPGLGAIETWLMSKGNIFKNKDISKEEIDSFFSFLSKSNSTLLEVLKSPSTHSAKNLSRMIEKYRFDDSFERILGNELKKRKNKYSVKNSFVKEGQNRYYGHN